MEAENKKARLKAKLRFTLVPMTITITFSAEEIIVGSAALDNRWPKK